MSAPNLKIHILPAMGDEGMTLGSALFKANEENENISWINKYQVPYYGNELSPNEIKDAIESFKYQINSKYIGITMTRGILQKTKI